ncbi:hypothetical protein [Streptoalloteichus hindustanus]|uniref:Uncharacterized protein n=1 Tax=Streptoalloteichus hindustanus TaxID=2017 RepID=A0A1M5BC68_STRHI|nr:hypothetical protein [Streptoalloteichus hindustanus]SHF39917.1 hypothetical protein SAMN05444320_103497 [Streptoalloteichus hindustanus]
MTWNNQPGQATGGKQGEGAGGSESSVDITDWMANYANGSAAWHGFMVNDNGHSDPAYWKKLAVDEAAPTASYLLISYNDWPYVTGQPGCDGCSWHTRDIEVGVDTVDPNGDDRYVEFYVGTDPVHVYATQIASSGTITKTGGSNPAVWKIPAAALEWNKTYYWYARVRDGYMPANSWNVSQVYSFSTKNGTPATPSLQGPSDRAVVSTKQPVLTVGAVTDPDNDTVQYEFSVATGSDGQSGLVAKSGWLDSPSWTVPVGVLKDGVNYTWTARARDKMPETVSTLAASRKFKVDLRLGAQGPVPGDAVGPVTVNLSTGNVITRASTPAMKTVGGDVSVQFTYNSQGVEETGLVGSYYTGTSNDGIKDTDSPVLVRTDPQVSYWWPDGSPYEPVIPKDGFRIRW